MPCIRRGRTVGRRAVSALCLAVPVGQGRVQNSRPGPGRCVTAADRAAWSPVFGTQPPSWLVSWTQGLVAQPSAHSSASPSISRAGGTPNPEGARGRGGAGTRTLILTQFLKDPSLGKGPCEPTSPAPTQGPGVPQSLSCSQKAGHGRHAPLAGAISATGSPGGPHRRTPAPTRNVCPSPLLWPRDRFCPRLRQNKTGQGEAGRGHAHLELPLVAETPRLLVTTLPSGTTTANTAKRC